MGAQGIYNDERHAPVGARPRGGGPDLGAKDIGRTSWGQTSVKPALTPVHEPEAIDFIVGAKGLHQPLAATPLATPHAREGRMECELDLILDIEVCAGQEV
jgi:hypothetical protein